MYHSIRVEIRYLHNSLIFVFLFFLVGGESIALWFVYALNSEKFAYSAGQSAEWSQSIGAVEMNERQAWKWNVDDVKLCDANCAYNCARRVQNTFDSDDENKILISDGQNHLARNSFLVFLFSLARSLACCFLFLFSFPIDSGCLPVHMYASMHIFSFHVLSFRQIAYNIY